MDQLANTAPTGEPAAPVTPAEPVVNEPAAPVDANLTDDEKLLQQEDDDWEAAEKKIFPGLKKGKKKEGEADEPTDTTKETTTPEQTTQTTTVANQDDAEAKVEPENVTPEPGTPSARAAEREYQAQVQAVRSDIRAKLFPDVATQLTDKNGDPITGIDDVIKYDNPRTGEPFTEEEAGMWFLSANQQLKDQLAVIEKQVEQIADVHLTLKDEADVVKAEFGAWLDAHPEDKKELWADFESTLVKDPESGLILRAPISLERFYRRNLKNVDTKTTTHSTTVAPTTTDTTTVTQTTTVDPKAAEEEAKAKRAAKRADRSDIYTGGEKQVEDPEDTEWAAAEKKVFGNR